MDYNRNKKYFEEQSLKGAIIALVIGVIIFLGGLKGGAGVAIFGLIIAGIGGFLIYSKTSGRPTDSEIDQVCVSELKNLKERALKKHGLDEDQIKEADPIEFNGYLYDDVPSTCMYQVGKDRLWRSSFYEGVMFLFSAEQVYCYKYRFSLIADEKREQTEEYFYRDIVSAATQSKTKEYKNKAGKTENINYEFFKLTTSGGTVMDAAIRNMGDSDRPIQAMKSLLRNNKQQMK